MSSPAAAANLRTIKLLLFGVGNVGRELVKQVTSSNKYYAEKYALKFKFTGIVDSSGVVSAASASQQQHLDDSTLQDVLKHKKDGKKLSAHTSASKSQIHELIAKLVDTRTIVIDCSATDTTAELLIQSAQLGAGVVLANKKPLTVAQSVFDRLVQATGRSRLRYESTVGAGTPMVAALHRVLGANDVPKKLQGTFSGTLGFLTTGLQEGRPYSEVVNEAAKLGYTEPDPRDDLGGVDVARKALILARTMGVKAEMSDVNVEPLFPKEFEKLSIDEFVKSLPKLDDEYSKRNDEAKKAGSVLRYVALVEGSKLSVGLSALKADSPIGLLSGTENMLELHTSIYNPKPLVIRGYGAGAEVTATGVLADIVEVADVLQ